jgi:hypothetical protein
MKLLRLRPAPQNKFPIAGATSSERLVIQRSLSHGSLLLP